MDEAEQYLATLYANGQYQKVADMAAQGLMQHPDWGFGWQIMGASLVPLNRFDDALQSFRRAVVLLPDDPVVYFNLGVLLERYEQLQEAERHYRRAIALHSDFAQALTNLGNLLRKTGAYREALEVYRRAQSSMPANTDIAHNIAVTLADQGEAAQAYQASLENLTRNPESGLALGHHFKLARDMAVWDGMESLESRLRAVVRDENRNQGDIFPFNYLAVTEATRSEQKRCALAYAQHTFGHALSKPSLVPGDRPGAAQGDRLRIGYLSSDFHAHATSLLMVGVLEQHDRSRHEIHLYSTGPEETSGMRQRVMAASEHFHELSQATAEQIASRIVSDQIDILVDLKGYTLDNRLQITALRPAPVIVSWLGYPGTLGHERLADYIIGDPIVTPLEHADDYSELIAQMPWCYQPNDSQRPVGDPMSRAEAGLPEEAFVICSFNQTYKITPTVFDAWCQVLQAVEGSVLWLLQPAKPGAVDRLEEVFRSRGLDPARLILAPTLSVRDHMRRLQCADLSLDTFPYTSHTTGSDILWAGVPLITVMGETFASRVAASLLNSVGLQDLVAKDWPECVQKAIALAHDREACSQLRQRLQAARREAPLFDTARFTRDLEALYARMWDDHVQGVRRPLPAAPSTTNQQNSHA